MGGDPHAKTHSCQSLGITSKVQFFFVKVNFTGSIQALQVESGFSDSGFPWSTNSHVLSKGPVSLVEIRSVLFPLLTVPAMGVTLVQLRPVTENQA